MKTKLNNHLKEIMVHDIEAAAFIIVSVSLLATFSSFALNSSEAANSSKRSYNPQSVQIIDLDNDGYNDMIITHQDGHVEHSFSRN